MVSMYERYPSFACLLGIQTLMLCLRELAGRTDKLRGVFDDDEGRDRLEKSIEAIFPRAVQESESEVDTRWIIAVRQSMRTQLDY